ncbi:class I SAM-dependent methyltransferase [Lentibacillus saliphilus]|uniref:class I SAM-dependent methyltransferase n=1 Tax=Lentibacillus saliphilus TaxID=2737028 RepID=UPI001FE5D890|nr:class I SAM-dependent methyltransferase [Lentibacillus saliphilus]
MANNWHSKSKQMWDYGSRKDIIPFINTYCRDQQAILDIGCGDGYGSIKLHKSGHYVTGVDLSEEMVALAQQSAQSNDITFLQGNATALPFVEQQFDAVMCINVLEWTEMPLEALREIKRVLKPGGRLFAGILGPTAGPRAHSYPRLEYGHAICNTMMPWEFQQLATNDVFLYEDGMGVFKEGVKREQYADLPEKLQQALTFMWVFCLQKRGDNDD